MANEFPKLDIDKIKFRVQEIAEDRFYKGSRKVTKLLKMQSGIKHTRGQKSFYHSWNLIKLTKTKGVLENPSIQAARFQTGYSTVAIQVFKSGKYIGWRTSSDPHQSINRSLTAWCEKFIPRAKEANTNGKRRTFHINVPMNKFGIKDEGVSKMIHLHLPKIRKSIKSGIHREIGKNLKKYTLKR